MGIQSGTFLNWLHEEAATYGDDMIVGYLGDPDFNPLSRFIREYTGEREWVTIGRYFTIDHVEYEVTRIFYDFITGVLLDQQELDTPIAVKKMILLTRMFMSSKTYLVDQATPLR